MNLEIPSADSAAHSVFFVVEKRPRRRVLLLDHRTVEELGFDGPINVVEPEDTSQLDLQVVATVPQRAAGSDAAEQFDAILPVGFGSVADTVDAEYVGSPGVA